MLGGHHPLVVELCVRGGVSKQGQSSAGAPVRSSAWRAAHWNICSGVGLRLHQNLYLGLDGGGDQYMPIYLFLQA